MMRTEAEWEVDCCVHGYHIYKSNWMGEQLDCVRELLNTGDRFAVAVMKDGTRIATYHTTVGYLPQKSIYLPKLLNTTKTEHQLYKTGCQLAKHLYLQI